MSLTTQDLDQLTEWCLDEKRTSAELTDAVRRATNDMVAGLAIGGTSVRDEYLKVVLITTSMATLIEEFALEAHDLKGEVKTHKEDAENLGKRLQAQYRRVHELEDEVDRLEELKDKRTARRKKPLDLPA